MNDEQNVQSPLMEPQQVDGVVPASTPQTAPMQLNAADPTESVMQPAAPLSMQPQMITEQPGINPAVANGGNVAPVVPKKVPKGLIIGLVAVVVIALAVFCAFKFLVPSPYKIYKGMIKETFAQGREVLGFDNDDFDSAVLSGNLQIDTNIEEADWLADYSYDFLYGYDIKNNKMELMLGLKEKEKTIIDAFAYLLNDKLYLKSDKIFDYPIELGDLELNLEEMMEAFPVEDIEYLYNKLEEALINSLSEQDFKTSTKTVTVDGKQIKVKDNYVDISSKNINKILKGFLNTFKNDNKSLDILASMIGEDSSTIKEMIDMVLEQDLSILGIKVRFSIYTKSMLNKSAGYAIKIANEEIIRVVNDGDKGVVELSLGDFKYKADIKGDVADFKLEISGEEFVKGKATAVSDEETKVEVSVADIIMNLSVVHKKDKKVETVAIDVALEPEDDDIDEYIKVKLTLRSELDAKVADVNVNDAKKPEDLDEEALTQALEKLEDIIADTPFYSLIEMVVDQFEDDYYEDDYYDDDYYYDDDFYYDEDFDFNVDEDFYYDEDFGFDLDEDDYYYDDTY